MMFYIFVVHRSFSHVFKPIHMHLYKNTDHENYYCCLVVDIDRDFFIIKVLHRKIIFNPMILEPNKLFEFL